MGCVQRGLTLYDRLARSSGAATSAAADLGDGVPVVRHDECGCVVGCGGGRLSGMSCADGGALVSFVLARLYVDLSVGKREDGGRWKLRVKCNK